MQKRSRPVSLALRAAALTLAASASLAHAVPAAPAPAPSVAVADQGPTRLVTRGADGVALTVDLIADIQKDPPAEAINACTGGRIPCSLVRALQIHHGATAVEVPPSLHLRLADVNRASLIARSKGQYLLTLTGGDASAAYDARILFDKARVIRLEIVSRLAGTVTERTEYFSVISAFD